MDIKRTSTAVWTGSGTEGQGTLTTKSGVLDATPYSFTGRFAPEKNAPGTNPEELIAAAHAGCFTMALAGVLSGAGHVPEELRTEATVRIEQNGKKWNINASHLNVVAKVPGIERELFQRLAEEAKANCPVSRVLKVNVSLETRLS